MVAEDIRPIVFERVMPCMIVSDHQFFLEEECGAEEQATLGGLHHFGIHVLWGLTGDPDPTGYIWPSTQYRPVIPVMGCIPAAEA